MLLILLLSCSDKSDPGASAAADSAPCDSPAPGDSAGSDAGGGVGDTDPGDTDPDDTDPGDTAPGEPDGTLLIEQIKTDGSLIGEAALLVGPDGTSVLIDVGSEIDGPAVLEAVDHHLPERAVDWVVLTHWHSDHVGAFAALFGGDAPPLEVRRGVISRGRYDLSASAAHREAYEATCEVLYGEGWAAPRVDLCRGPREGGCSLADGGPWPADSCPGLALGDLEDAGDDADGDLSRLDLGGGAGLYFFLADGVLATADGPVSAAEGGVAIGYSTINDENARSVAGLVRYGSFRYLFGGDLTGGGSGSPDMESFVAARGDALQLPGGEALVPGAGVDLLQGNHHGFITATGEAWLSWLLPDDGRPRNAVFGSTYDHDGAPAQQVLDRLSERLGGGWMWVTERGRVAGDHQRLRCLDQAILAEVTDGGQRYTLSHRQGDTLTDSLSFEAVDR